MKSDLAPTSPHDSNQISIGVTSLGYLSAQQKWILSTSKNHLKKNSNTKILVISFYTEIGIFKQLTTAQTSKTEAENNVLAMFHNIDFINWNNYLKASQELELISMLKAYDVVLWDLPEIEFIKKWDQVFSVYMSYIRELKILSPRSSDIEQSLYLKNTLSYFREHGIPFDERLTHAANPRSIKE